jgi:hypothetical protein
MSEEISIDDFERIFDEQTGEYIYRFKKTIAERRGFTDLMEINFNIIKDKKTGKKLIQIDSLPNNFYFKSKIYLIVY